MSKRSAPDTALPAPRPGRSRSRSRSSEPPPRSLSWPSSRRLWETRSCAPTLWWRRCSQLQRRKRRPTWSRSTWARPPTSGWTRRGDWRARLARGFGRQTLEAPQVVPVVVERDPQVAVDGELSEFGVHTDAASLLFAQCPDVVDEPVARACPLRQCVLQRDAVEVPLVIGVELERGPLARGHRPNARLEAFLLSGRQVCCDVTERPGADASRVVVRDQLSHGDHQLLAGLELLQQGIGHADGSGFMSRSRGLAVSSSATTAASTSSGVPALP